MRFFTVENLARHHWKGLLIRSSSPGGVLSRLRDGPSSQAGALEQQRALGHGATASACCVSKARYALRR